jgi:hypothetical protein
MKRWDDETLGEAWIDGGEEGSGTCPRGAQAWAVVAREGHPDSGAFLDHAASCAACASALRLAREIHAGAAVHTSERTPGLWAALTRTVLHPVPALAYLVVLAFVVPLALRGRPEVSVARPEPLRMLAEVRLTGDVVHRGEGGVEAARLARPSGPTALRLYADLEAVRGQAGARVRIRLLRDGREVFSRTESTDTVGPDGSVLVVLEDELLGSGTVVVELAAIDPSGVAPGPAFRQTLQID